MTAAVVTQIVWTGELTVCTGMHLVSRMLRMQLLRWCLRQLLLPHSFQQRATSACLRWDSEVTVDVALVVHVLRAAPTPTLSAGAPAWQLACAAVAASLVTRCPSMRQLASLTWLSLPNKQ
jgi:hypothetical protein